jgi:hypothetical protein
MKSASQQTHRISSVSQSAKSTNPANPTQQTPFGFEGPAEHDEEPPQQGDEGDVTLPSLDLAAKRLIQKAGLTFSFSANQQFFMEVDRHLLLQSASRSQGCVGSGHVSKVEVKRAGAVCTSHDPSRSSIGVPRPVGSRHFRERQKRR